MINELNWLYLPRTVLIQYIVPIIIIIITDSFMTLFTCTCICQDVWCLVCVGPDASVDHAPNGCKLLSGITPKRGQKHY
jgi:hypothetical protein